MNIRQRVDLALAGLQITAPVELDDVLEIHSRIALRLEPGERLEVYHRIRDVVIAVREVVKGSLEITHERVLEAS